MDRGQDYCWSGILKYDFWYKLQFFWHWISLLACLMTGLLKESSQFLTFWLDLGEKSKMLVHNDHINHIKLAMLSLAVSNKFHYTYFRTKSYTLVSCNSRKCLMCNSTSLYNRKKMKCQKMVVLENWFLLWSFQCLIPNYATDSLCHFPFPLTSQGFELDPIYMR